MYLHVALTHNTELFDGFYVVHIPESAQPGHSVSTSVITLPQDLAANIVFSVNREHSNIFAIGKHSGQLLVKKAVLDYETTTQYQVQVEARVRHCAQCVYGLNVTVMVDDIIDEPPVFSHSVYNISLSQWAPEGTRFLHTDVLDLDQHDSIQLAISATEPPSADSMFALDHTTQSLITTKQMTLGRYKLLVTATDTGGLSSAAEVIIGVTDPSAIEPTLEKPSES